MDDLQKLKQLYDKATDFIKRKGGVASYLKFYFTSEWERLNLTAEQVESIHTPFELIVALHNAFPELIKRLEEAEALLKEAQFLDSERYSVDYNRYQKKWKEE